MNGTADKNCKLELHYLKVGPLRVSGKLALVNEHGKKSFYAVMPWYTEGLLQASGFAARACVLTPFVTRAAAKKIAQAVLLAGVTVANPIVGAALTVMNIALAAELNTFGTSKFKRQIMPDSVYKRTPEASIDISHEDFMKLKLELNNKKKTYSFLFNNCVQQSRRQFNEIKERFYPDEAPEPIYQNPFKRKAPALKL
jgi:hypothetical protein